jgi:hypothetical protein
MKRFFIFGLILLLGVAVLTGCGKKDEQGDGQSQNGNGTVQDNQPPDGQDLNTSENRKMVLDLLDKGLKQTEFSCELVYTDGGVSTESLCYFRDSVTRIERKNSMVYIIDMDGAAEFSIATKRGRFLSHEQYNDDIKDGKSPLYWVQEFMSNQKFTYKGTETFDNKTCHLIQIEVPGGVYNAWIHPEIGLFVKVDGGEDVFEYKSLKAGPGSVPANVMMRVPDDVGMEEIN